MSSDTISFLLNWHATSYHAPLFLAQAKGYFQDEGVKVAILEPNDPSDVTELIGRGSADMGAKAMVHTIAAKARSYGVTSVGTLLDEPFTGLLYLKGGVEGRPNNISDDFTSLKGKRVGYVGEFGRVQCLELAAKHGMKEGVDLEFVRVGMDVVGGIIDGRIDCGMGVGAVNGTELEQWCATVGRPATDVKLIRIDELAELGCCCFCSILVIVNDAFLAANGAKVAAVMRALKRATDDMFADPAKAWVDLQRFKKQFRGDAKSLYAKMYERCFPFMSRDLKNVERDWAKVVKYCQRIGVCPDGFEANFTNEFVQWEHAAEPADPLANQVLLAKQQEEIRVNGGVLSAPVAATA
ncbi:NMT1/THI5 like-domain-containing protein [Rhodotorula diobovata]|uniref:4-amino-5-hydroxymethyl-2-methylpyrimidine phosphate synthase n=1 Tax=Rhodotorula diobovata TaxID=5288 RepID=A0A5C5FQ40_9BASI|nr:NMT1/THI5 like-domain-containing protein [Rhodotorula diobovata]